MGQTVAHFPLRLLSDCLLELSFKRLQGGIAESFHGNLCMFLSEYVRAADPQSSVSSFRRLRASKEFYFLGTEVVDEGMLKASAGRKF